MLNVPSLFIYKGLKSYFFDTKRQITITSNLAKEGTQDLEAQTYAVRKLNSYSRWVGRKSDPIEDFDTQYTAGGEIDYFFEYEVTMIKGDTHPISHKYLLSHC